LRAYERFPELVQLYRSRGAHRQALELLCTLGIILLLSLFFVSSNRDITSFFTFHVTGQSSNQLNPLHGTEETVKYLQTLAEQPDFTNLVLEFSTWVLKADPDQGLRIFTHSHTYADCLCILFLPAADRMCLCVYSDMGQEFEPCRSCCGSTGAAATEGADTSP
jgi:hypothetical protein